MQNAPERMNDTGTCTMIDTPLTQPGSRDVRFELVDRDGRVHPINVRSAQDAAKTAALYWPDQSQDPDRMGRGWDIQTAGVE